MAKVKVENMQLQHQEFAARAERAADGAGEPVGSIGVIAVAAGDGFLKVFRSLGAMVVHGGQTMNPSVQDILAAVNSSGYKELIILPNNSNIVLTARQVKDLTPHTIEIVPTEIEPAGHRRAAGVQLRDRPGEQRGGDGAGCSRACTRSR